MTIEQIVEQLPRNKEYPSYIHESTIELAMQQYADQQSAEKDTQLKDLHQQLSSLKASMDILVDDNERLSKRSMRWVKASERLPEKSGEENKVVVKYDGNVCYGFKNYDTKPKIFICNNGLCCLTLNCEWLDESIISKGEEWIACNKDLPKEGGRYWCYCEEVNDLGISHFQWNCCYDEVEKVWTDNFINFKVTHWRPLPIPPQGDEIKK